MTQVYIGIIFYKQKTLQKGHGTDLGSFAHMICCDMLILSMGQNIQE